MAQPPAYEDDKDDSSFVRSLASRETKTLDDESVQTISSHSGRFIIDGDELTKRFKGIEDGSTLTDQMQGWQDSITAQESSPRYQLNELLGLGAQGLVFSVTDKDCGRRVALKTMRGEDRVPTQIARFVHEAQVTAQLEHPGIVPVHELNVLPDGTLFYTMKQVGGRPLSDEIRLYARQLDRRFHLLQIFLKICDTMSFAHSHGVLHRDLKPANIMLGDFGEVLVLDWGLSKVVGQADVVSVRSKNAAESDSGIYVTRDGHAVGTPAYMSPEQARGHRDSLDQRSDIYSLGVILYEMLTQHLPYTGMDVETVLDQVSRGQIVPIIRQPLGQHVSPQMAAIVHKAMAFEVEDRYQFVDDLKQDLQSYLAGEAVTAYADSVPERFVRYLRRNQAQVKTASILISLFVISVVSFWSYRTLDAQYEIQRYRKDAFFYLTNSMYDEAREAFTKIIEIDDTNLIDHNGLKRAKDRKQALLEQERAAEKAQRDAERVAEAQARKDKQAQEAARLLKAAQAARDSALWDDALKYYNQAYLLNGESETAAMKVLLDSIRDGRQSERDLLARKQIETLIQAASDSFAEKDFQTALNKANVALENLRNDKFNLRGSVVALRDDIKSALDAAVREQALVQRRQQAAQVMGQYQEVFEEYKKQQRLLDNLELEHMKQQKQPNNTLAVANQRQEIDRIEKEIIDLNRNLVGLLSRAEELDPDADNVRLAWADYYERDLKRAERRLDDAAAAVAAERGTVYDKEGRYRLLFSEQAALTNADATRSMFLRALAYNESGTLQAVGDRILVDPQKTVELPAGRYVVFVEAEPYTAMLLKRGETQAFKAQAMKRVDSSVAYVPGGYVYDQQRRRHPKPVAGFWMMQREVTCGEYLEFLNAIARRDQRQEHAPRDMIHPRSIWGADGKGRFRLVHNFRESREGRIIDPMLPVYGISYRSVSQYIKWKNLELRRKGILDYRWRLPTEREWRLAAQSGDGRLYPWGDRVDNQGDICYSARAIKAGQANVLTSTEIIKNVASFPGDRTVHGIYDLGGSLAEYVEEVDAVRGLVMICGGCFQDNDDFRLQTTSVRYVDMDRASIQVGLRLVLVPVQE